MKPVKPMAFLALWNGIDSLRRGPEYEAWHTFEHVPERVGLPGFIEGRRYRSTTTPTNYFTCYWIDSLQALSTPEYRDVFTNPTPWSGRMRSALRDFLRLPCTLGGGFGSTSASRLATLHLRTTTSALEALLDTFLQESVSNARLVCGQWGEVHPASDFPLVNITASAEGEFRNFVVMLQHHDPNTLRGSTRDLLQRAARMSAPVTEPAFFELLTEVRQDTLANPRMGRQPPRTELMKTFIEETET